jgi:phospholipid transport system substrate-binding protein
MKRYLWSVLMVIALAAASSAQAGEKEAKTYVLGVSNKVLEIISNKKIDQGTKQTKLIKLFEQTVDTKWIGRFVLGKYYKTATPVQKKKYDDIYHEFLIRSYVPRFKEYKGQKFELAETQSHGKGEYLVKTNILSANAAPIRVDYRVREDAGTFHVIDIISEGVSLINTQRSEFGSVVSREGMDYLLDQLKQRLETLKAND